MVIEDFPAEPGSVSYVLAVCDCGTQVRRRANAVRMGNTRSCGCLHREQGGINRTTHGLNRTPAHRAWCRMKSRCGPKSPDFAYYGGRGIKVCKRWSDSFENFFADMGEPPAGMSLDRINNDGDYEPGNCRWATPTQQMRNRRSSRMATINGETKCLKEWWESLGTVPYRTAIQRIRSGGWEPYVALTEPVRPSTPLARRR